MKKQNLTDDEVAVLAARFKSSFERLAEIQEGLPWRYGTYGEAPERMKAYGEKIADLLLSDSILLSGFPELLSKKIRILDISDFMLTSIQGPATSTAENLKAAGFSLKAASGIERRCLELAQDIERLNKVNPGPIYYGQRFAQRQGLSPQTVNVYARNLPAYLEAYATFMKLTPITDRPGFKFKTSHKHMNTAFFYVYLQEAGGTFEALSGLLTLMTNVRDEMYPKSQRTTWYSDLKPASLSTEALQKAITRFMRRNPHERQLMPYQVREFLRSPLRRIRLPFLMLSERLPFLRHEAAVDGS